MPQNNRTSESSAVQLARKKGGSLDYSGFQGSSPTSSLLLSSGFSNAVKSEEATGPRFSGETGSAEFGEEGAAL